MVKPVEPEWGALAGDGPLSPAEIDAQARALLAQMTLAEKIKQMSGDRSFLFGGIKMARAYNAEPVPAGENRRLGIPGIRFTDGPRGVVMYHSTCFPVAMARGASWDVELEARIGDAIGVEARAQGANYFGGVCINLLRHPGWGRAQETYGEDPHHLGEMGAALVRGVQRHIMACIKHYACNSIERSRFKVNVVVDERTLHEVYLPHFRRCVEAGAASVMSAYNKVNGEYCSHNRRLLTGILRDEWGFDGFVLSDFVFAVRDAKAAALAGLDVEMPFPRHYGRRLARLVRTGEVPEAVVDAAVLRILRQKLRFSRIGEPGRYTQDVVAGPAHRALAREAAEQSAVLLKNDPLAGQPLLPIGPEVRRIALLGRLAAVPNIGDEGSSAVHPPQVVTPLEGLRRRSPGPEIVYVDGGNLAQAAEAARALRPGGRGRRVHARGRGRVHRRRAVDRQSEGRRPVLADPQPGGRGAHPGGRRRESPDGRRAGRRVGDRHRELARPRPGHPDVLVPRHGGRERARKPAVRGRQPIGQAAVRLPEVGRATALL